MQIHKPQSAIRNPTAVIAGLGNPGSEYCGTRHNIGFHVVDALAELMQATWKKEPRYPAVVAQLRIAGHAVHLVKPLSYMNDCGRSLYTFIHNYKLAANALAVVYDDINLDLGRLKLSIGGSDGGHNGIADVIHHVGNTFVRYRIGIGAKKHPAMDLKDYVLGQLNQDERNAIEAQLDHYIKGVMLLVREGPVFAMNHLNKRPKRKTSNEPNSNEE